MQWFVRPYYLSVVEREDQRAYQPPRYPNTHAKHNWPNGITENAFVCRKPESDDGDTPNVYEGLRTLCKNRVVGSVPS